MDNKNLTDVIARIDELNSARRLAEQKTNEVGVHERDLKAIETVKGLESTEYQVKKEILDTTQKELKDVQDEITKLSFKKSELKPYLDEAAKEFEKELRNEQEREYHLEISDLVDFENDEKDVIKQKQSNGRKAFKTLIEYLYHDVNWNAKTATGLVVLVRNMEENKPWTRAEDFDNVISLRSSNILVLWKYILEEMTGKGYYDARKFLECWANVGKSISDAVRDIQKLHEKVRILGTNLNLIEDEYDLSENDIEEEELTLQQEVNPEV